MRKWCTGLYPRGGLALVRIQAQEFSILRPLEERVHLLAQFLSLLPAAAQQVLDRWFRRAVAKPKPPEDGETPRPAKDPAAGGARKSRSMMPHDWLEQTREDWADQVNAALERRDFPARVDHRSWATRALEAFELGDIDTAIALSREPNPHIGTAVPAMTLKRAIVGDLEPLYLAERAQDIEALNDQLVVEWDAVNDDIARGEAELQELENQLQTIRAAAAELELAVERDERDRQRGGKGR